MIRQISLDGRARLASWEGGYCQEAYLDSGGALTIGVGHLITPFEQRSGKILISGEWVDYRNGLTIDQCQALYDHDLDIAEAAVNRLVDVPLVDDQFAVLVSFVHNVGVAAFAASTLLRLLNSGAYAAVPGQLRRWVYDNGRIVQGLVNRREAEIALWESTYA